MPQRLQLILLIPLMFLVVSNIQAAGPVPKPRSPLSLTMTPSVEPVVGRSVQFTVVITSQVDASNARVSVTLPDGSVLEDGILQWQGDLDAGVEQTLTFRTTLPLSSHQPVVAQAVIGGAGQPQFSAYAQYVTQSAANYATAITAVSNDKPRVVERNGRRIEEYVLQ